MLAEIAKTCNFTIKQCVGLHKHFFKLVNRSESSILDELPAELQVDHAETFAEQFLKNDKGKADIDTARGLEEKRSTASITFSEYMLGISYLVRHAELEEKARFLFQFYDSDVSEYLFFHDV